ncbi:hypothetical protein BpHYR1_027277 [Brachionus plicatilis]|uniref:Uncharacterized protein n=1 Tax=Brachionus plicatilis TaxID=10195 RepID=A0A3M7RBU9_BRAPC|nr:hypothetical protein BpHYR1_027277 [Brachionus plicatilis]
MVYGDFEYLYEKCYKDTIYWRCAVTNPLCKARIHSDLSYKIVKLANDYRYHEDDQYDNKEDKIQKKKEDSSLKKNLKKQNLFLVYSLLPKQQEITYTRFFNILKLHGVTNFPKYVLCDYELAIINSVKKCFPGTNIGGCYFHLFANFWKQYLKLIPFVPQKDILSVFDELQENFPESIKQIYQFFEKYYIRLPKSPGSKLRSKPSYPIDTWHVLIRVSENLPRSNNSIEAWHKAFSQDIYSHPETNRLINHFL